MNGPAANPQHRYQAFISYSHAADGELAPALQQALTRFTAPWYSRSTFPVFRDETGLALTPDLWADIQGRLEQSRCFILLASSEAAQSPWVDKEIRFWLEHRPGDPLLMVLTGGELSWRNDRADFDWSHTTALPRSLQGVFQREPLWADLRWAKAGADLSLRNRRFFVEIAKVVAGVRQVPLETVLNEAERQHRNAMRALLAGVTALAILALTAVGAAVLGFQAKRTADRLAAAKQVELDQAAELLRQRELGVEAQQRRERDEKNSTRLAAQAAAALPEDRELSTLLALKAVEIARTPEAENALRNTLRELVPPLVLTGHAGIVDSARFSSGGQQVLTSGADGTVRLWDAATGALLLKLEFTHDLARGDGVHGVLSSDGAKILTMVTPETLAMGYWAGGSVQLHDAATGRQLVALADRYAVVADLSPDGKQIVTGGFDSAVRVWDSLTGKKRLELAGHDSRVASVSFQPGGDRIVSGSWDGTARVWEVATGRNLATLAAGKNVDQAAFNPDGSRVFTMGRVEDKEQELRLWDWAGAPGRSLVSFTGHEGPVQAFAFSRDGKWLATAGLDRTARIWETATGAGVRVLSRHEEPVTGVDFSPNGRWVVTAGIDRAARIWDRLTGEELMELGWNRLPRTCVAFSPDGKRIVTGTSEGAVLVYTCRVCGSVDDLVALARGRVTRELSDAEKRKSLGSPR
jgi:WD40 repeat protein